MIQRVVQRSSQGVVGKVVFVARSNSITASTSTSSSASQALRRFTTRATPVINVIADKTYHITKAMHTTSASYASVPIGPYMEYDDEVSSLPPPPASPAAKTYHARSGIDTKPFAVPHHQANSNSHNQVGASASTPHHHSSLSFLNRNIEYDSDGYSRVKMISPDTIEFLEREEAEEDHDHEERPAPRRTHHTANASRNMKSTTTLTRF